MVPAAMLCLLAKFSSPVQRKILPHAIVFFDAISPVPVWTSSSTIRKLDHVAIRHDPDFSFWDADHRRAVSGTIHGLQLGQQQRTVA
jgi:hypothetical protein